MPVYYRYFYINNVYENGFYNLMHDNRRAGIFPG